MPIGLIESLDHEARGVTRLDGKAIFVEGALPGETVSYVSVHKKPSFEIARLESVLHASVDRVQPQCPHFGVCGGCRLQHLASLAQVAAKQRILEKNLWHMGRVKADELYAPIYGNPWAYRFRARLSLHVSPPENALQIGFHEQKSSAVADLSCCPILPPHVSALLPPLHQLVRRLSIFAALPQIEIAVGEEITALVLRLLEPLSTPDKTLLREFADRHNIVFYVQPGDPASATRFYPTDGENLSYCLPDFGVEHTFSPTEFTQINPAINRVLARRAIALLEARAGEKIVDMFCGLGNFTLPIALSGAQVLGVEGNRTLVRRARENAAANGLAGQVSYAEANLFAATPESLASLGTLDKMLIDPPREGALSLVKALGKKGPNRIVYISCNPSTLARDASILTNQKAYFLRGAGVINMFPHTAHIESIALFDKR